MRLLVFALALIVVSVLAETSPVSGDGNALVIHFEPQRPARGVMTFRSHCGGYFYQSDVLPWLAKCERKIRAAGFDEKMFRGYHIQIRFDVEKGNQGYVNDGHTAALTVIKSSGREDLDQVAVALVQRASPFDIPDIGIPSGRSLILDLDYPKVELKYLPLNDRDPRWYRDPFVAPVAGMPGVPSGTGLPTLILRKKNAGGELK